jgi:hypothetical protein
MAILNFPSAPSVGQIYAHPDAGEYKWNGYAWERTNGGVTEGPIGPAGPAGPEGLSAYEVAVTNGYAGTEAEWLESLNGADGKDGAQGAAGLSAYEIAVTEGYSGTESEWLESLNGADGAPGIPGITGPIGPAGPTAVSSDPENAAVLSPNDGLIFVPTQSAGGAIVEEAPPTAAPTSLWFDSDGGRMYLNYVNPMIRSFEFDFGITATPLWLCQRTTT